MSMTKRTGLLNIGGITCIQPEWPMTKNVMCYTTTRLGGCSQKPFDSFNLGLHVNDVEADVFKNRQTLVEELSLPSEPVWLNQIHGNAVCDDIRAAKASTYDAAWSDSSGDVLSVMTADCLPVAFCSTEATEVAVAHAGWRGLADGVLQNTVERFTHQASDIFAWLGPAIGPKKFEVGDEVREQFLTAFKGVPSSEISAAFTPSDNSGKWFADLYQLARSALKSVGVRSIYGGDYCTHTDQDLFFSHRRDGVKSGRMATLIWLSDAA